MFRKTIFIISSDADVIYFLLFNVPSLHYETSFSSLFQFATPTFQMSGYGSFSSLQLIKEIDMMAISCDDKIDTFYGYQCHIAVIIHGVFLIFLTNRYYLTNNNFDTNDHIMN